MSNKQQLQANNETLATIVEQLANNPTATELQRAIETHVENTKNPHSVTATQVGALPAVADTTYPNCYYYRVGSEQEWINPPMIKNTEYRTTERYQGKVVYRKIVDVTVPENATTVTTTLSVGTELVRYVAECGTYILPITHNTAFKRSVDVRKDGFVEFERSSDLTGLTDTIKFQLWYTKD